MLRRLQEIEWTFSNTAQAATGFLLALAIAAAVVL
jgi:hypothetical protein